MRGSPGPNSSLDNTKENICGDSSLVSLVQHHPGVLGQVWVHHCLPQQHAVREKENLDKYDKMTLALNDQRT